MAGYMYKKIKGPEEKHRGEEQGRQAEGNGRRWLKGEGYKGMGEKGRKARKGQVRW